MTAPVNRAQGPTTKADSRRSLVRLLIVAVLLAAVAGTAFGVWYFYLRTPPAPVSLENAPPAAGATTTPAAGTATPGASGSPSSAPSTGSGTATGIEGTWTVAEATGSFPDFTTFVGYRVNETLGSIGKTTAVGRTPDVTGTMTVSGTAITAVEMTADLTTLRSDDDRRDGQLRRQAIETDDFPTSTFTLTEPIELGKVPAEGGGDHHHRHGRLHAPWRHEEHRDPDPGAAGRRRRHRRRFDRRAVRRLRGGEAALAAGRRHRGPRDDGVPAPVHEGIGAPCPTMTTS